MALNRRLARRLVLIGLLLGCWLLADGRASAYRPGWPSDHRLTPRAMAARTQVFIGQGFDTCEVPSVDALRIWFAQSPYRAVNLYIGGKGRACSNQALTADLVAELAQIGWQFIPTWVGPQAPCYNPTPPNNKPRMSADPTVAHAQGIAEAAAAVKTAVALGLALPDGAGTIVYYDMEAYASQDPACNAPVQAFIAGWVNELHASGSLAGVYGNAHALVSFAALADAPDAIWPARWLYKTYTPDVTVWDVPGLPAGLWANHQRIWQYAGGHTETWNAAAGGPDGAAGEPHEARARHSETWGGVTLNIDCDVIDGIVAAISGPAPALRLHLPLILGAGPAR